MRNLDCKDIKALLSTLVDDAADGETRHAAECHLSECPACRSLIDEAEANDALVAAELDALMRPLPDGFEAAVLRRTAYTQYPRSAMSNWVTWLGWVAAAAALTLAVTIYVFDRQLRTFTTGGGQARITQPRPGIPAEYGVATQAGSRSAYLPSDLHRSFTYEGPLPSDAYPVQTTVVRNVPLPQPPRPDRVHVPAELIEAPPLTEPLPMQSVGDRPALPIMSREDAETLSITALLMDMLGRCDLTSFADAEEIRQIAEYDELPSRLAAARSGLSEPDRQIVLVAESMLTRIILGPLSLDDLHGMREAVLRLDLGKRLDAVSERWVPAEPL